MGERVFAMPDLGEGLEEGRIVRWLVSAGDTVALNQPLVEVETAKAVVEVPSPFAGRVVAIHGTEDDDVPVGGPLVTFDVAGSDSADTETATTEHEIADVRARRASSERRPDGGPVRAKPPVWE